MWVNTNAVKHITGGGELWDDTGGVRVPLPGVADPITSGAYTGNAKVGGTVTPTVVAGGPTNNNYQ